MPRGARTRDKVIKNIPDNRSGNGHLNKLTDEQRDDIFFSMCGGNSASKEARANVLAEKYDIALSVVYEIYNNELVIDRAKTKLEAKRIQNEMRLQILVAKALDVQEGFLNNETLGEPYQYLRQNAATDILNRAGIKAKEESVQEQRVVIESGVDFGFGDARKDSNEKQVEDNQNAGQTVGAVVAALPQ